MMGYNTRFESASDLANDVVDPCYLVISVDIHTHRPSNTTITIKIHEQYTEAVLNCFNFNL